VAGESKLHEVQKRLTRARVPPEPTELERFEQSVLPHLPAAYNLARWLTRNEQDAQDVVQEASLRALRFFGGFHGGNSRPWLLTIVRNTCYTWLRQNRPAEPTAVFDEGLHSGNENPCTPETMLLRKYDNRSLKQALEELPLEFREVLVLRELEGLSYKEIAEISGLQIGTVMSRLARARKRLQESVVNRMNQEAT